MNDRDPITEALTSLKSPPLDPSFAARVGARARAELRAPARAALDLTHLRRVVAGGLVPALLTLAAVAQTADAASTVAKIYRAGPGKCVRATCCRVARPDVFPSGEPPLVSCRVSRQACALSPAISSTVNTVSFV